MKTVKMTLVSTVVAAALGLALGLSAVPSDSYACHKGTVHGNQTDCGGGGPIQFTAELTAGAFVFNPVNPVEVTPNSRENELRSNTDLDMVRPNDMGALELTWNQVFNTCGELLDPDSVEGFFVGEDNWSIHKSGGVRVIFGDIVLQDAEVRVQLIGDEFDFSTTPFLPDSGQTSVFELTQFAINGRSEMGGPGGSQACQPPGGGGFDIFNLTIPSFLEITAASAP